MLPVPILFLSDSPEINTGLARITRDLCAQLVRNPRFRVGSLGLGGQGSRYLPWQQYQIQRIAGEWGQSALRRVWSDFAGNERGILFTIWDLTRTHWLKLPQEDRETQAFMDAGHFQKWTYFPLDAAGPGNRLTTVAADSLSGYHRGLAYTKWAKGIASNNGLKVDWMPHGINQQVFQPRDQKEARAKFFPQLHQGDTLIGINMTNQPRKDWGLAFQIIQVLNQKLGNVHLWAHIDMLQRAWSIPALAADMGLERNVIVTHECSDAELSYRYSACDMTMLPSLGEGFGYPLFESLSCGVPVIHGDYAGGAEIMRQAGMDIFLVEPQAMRLDTIHNCVRPVYDPLQWVQMAESVLDMDHDRDILRASVSFLDWKNLYPTWERWFHDGISS